MTEEKKRVKKVTTPRTATATNVFVNRFLPIVDGKDNRNETPRPRKIQTVGIIKI